MGAHPSGNGTSWADTEVIDVDQPHGLDYRALNHLAIAVRKRVNKEHKGYADATVGGEHLPGGCRILAITDSTADITTGAGDASIDITDGKFLGRGLIYDQTTNAFWCFTGDGTVSDNPYQILLGPSSICRGADFTWSGSHLFESSVDMTILAVDASMEVRGEFDASKAIFEGTVDFYSQIDMSTVIVEGTANFYDEVDFSTVNLDATTYMTDVSFNGLSYVFGSFCEKEAGDTTLAAGSTYQSSSSAIVQSSITAGNIFIYVTDTTDVDVVRMRGSDADGVPSSVMSVVPAGHHFKVTASGGGSLVDYWFIPFGDGSVELI